MPCVSPAPYEENVGAYASCNHGFASHTAHLFYRDVLGLFARSDTEKTLLVRFPDVDLEWCEGRMPTPHGLITLRWEKRGDKLAYTLAAPAGYKVAIDNRSGRELLKSP